MISPVGSLPSAKLIAIQVPKPDFVHEIGSDPTTTERSRQAESPREIGGFSFCLKFGLPSCTDKDFEKLITLKSPYSVFLERR